MIPAAAFVQAMLDDHRAEMDRELSRRRRAGRATLRPHGAGSPDIARKRTRRPLSVLRRAAGRTS